jgi:hypothetical protein
MYSLSSLLLTYLSLAKILALVPHYNRHILPSRSFHCPPEPNCYPEHGRSVFVPNVGTKHIIQKGVRSHKIATPMKHQWQFGHLNFVRVVAALSPLLRSIYTRTTETAVCKWWCVLSDIVTSVPNSVEPYSGPTVARLLKISSYETEYSNPFSPLPTTSTRIKFWWI